MQPNQQVPQMPQSPQGMPMQPQFQGPIRPPKQTHPALFFAVLMTIAFVGALGFGFWAFAGMQDNKINLDAKVEAASEVAVTKAEAAKEAEFAERDKDPFRGYTGPSTYGSLTYGFPKTWSVYLEEKDSGTILDYYGHPLLIRGLGKENSFAFRAQILDSPYDKEVEKFQKQAEKGEVAVSAFRLTQVPSVLGVRVAGEVVTDKQGVMVLLPIRDKTIKLWTESNDFAADFERIIESTTFNP